MKPKMKKFIFQNDNKNLIQTRKKLYQMNLLILFVVLKEKLKDNENFNFFSQYLRLFPFMLLLDKIKSSHFCSFVTEHKKQKIF